MLKTTYVLSRLESLLRSFVLVYSVVTWICLTPNPGSFIGFCLSCHRFLSNVIGFCVSCHQFLCIVSSVSAYHVIGFCVSYHQFLFIVSCHRFLFIVSSVSVYRVIGFCVSFLCICLVSGICDKKSD